MVKFACFLHLLPRYKLMTAQTPSNQGLAFCMKSRSLDELYAGFCSPFVVCPLGCVSIPRKNDRLEASWRSGLRICGEFIKIKHLPSL